MWVQIILSSIILLVLDAIFLYLMSQIFVKQVYEVQHSPLKLNYVGAVFTYALMIFAVNYFILIPKKSPIEAFLLGFVIYGVFEGTNYSMLKKWKPTTVLVDTFWGGTLFALTTYLTYTLKKMMKL